MFVYRVHCQYRELATPGEIFNLNAAMQAEPLLKRLALARSGKELHGVFRQLLFRYQQRFSETYGGVMPALVIIPPAAAAAAAAVVVVTDEKDTDTQKKKKKQKYKILKDKLPTQKAGREGRTSFCVSIKWPIRSRLVTESALSPPAVATATKARSTNRSDC